MPLDILYIGFVLGHGGDAVQMLELAAGMAARGKRVRVIVPELPTTLEFASNCLKRGLDVVRTSLIHVDAIASRQIPENLVELFRRNPAERIHLHTGDFCLSRKVTRVMGDLDIPPHKVMVTVHSPYDTLTAIHERAVAWAGAAGNRIWWIVCPSRHAMRVQIKYGVPERNLAFIANGVDINRFRNGDGLRIRNELNLSSNDDLLVYTSRLDSQKRPADALDAFIRIAPDYPPCHLAFVGTGELEAVLRKSAEAAGLCNRVHFAGYRSDVADWLAAATVWLLPTEAESFSLAVLEALAAGRPVLSTLCRGNDEVLVPGENALTHQVGDVDGIEAALRKLLTDTDLRRSLSANARLTASRYGVDRMVDQYAALYEGP